MMEVAWERKWSSFSFLKGLRRIQPTRGRYKKPKQQLKEEEEEEEEEEEGVGQGRRRRRRRRRNRSYL